MSAATDTSKASAQQDEVPETRPQVVFLKPVVLAAVRVTGPYSDTVHEAWRRVFAWMDHAALDPKPDAGYGLSYDNAKQVPAQDLRYAACVVMPNSWPGSGQDGIARMLFEGGTFLRSRVVGPYSKIGPVISELRDQFVSKNGLVFNRNKPVLTIYRNDTRRVSPDEQIADVCLPVFADRRMKPRD